MKLELGGTKSGLSAPVLRSESLGRTELLLICSLQEHRMKPASKGGLPDSAGLSYFLTVMGGPLGPPGGGALVTLLLAPPILFHVPVPSLPVATTTPGDSTL